MPGDFLSTGLLDVRERYRLTRTVFDFINVAPHLHHHPLYVKHLHPMEEKDLPQP